MVAEDSDGSGFHSFKDYLEYSRYTSSSRFLDDYKGKFLYKFLKWTGSPFESINPIVRTLYTSWTLRLPSKGVDPKIQLADASLNLLNNAADGMMVMSAGVSEGPFYRGGDLQVRPQDIPIDKRTGLVKPGRGISVNTDPAKAGQHGEVSRVDALPEGWGFFQHGRDPGHYEIGSPEPITPETYCDLILQVLLTPFEK